MKMPVVRSLVVAVLAGGLVAAFAASAPAGLQAAVKVKGVQTVVDEKKGLYEMQGSLVGSWTVTAFTERYASPTEYVGSGRERFQGCHDADRDGACGADEPAGTIRFVFTYWATFSSGKLVRGNCVHPVVGGTGDFAKAKGVILMKDVPTSSGVRTTYAGTLDYAAAPKPASARPTRSLASSGRGTACGS
jgi:hypothetical protein